MARQTAGCEARLRGVSSGGSASFVPRQASMSARAKPPARSHNGVSSRQPIMLDSIPMLHAPPSSTSISGSMAATWAALLGLKRPDGLALGATSGRATARNNFCAVSCAGMRKAMVSRPAEASGSTGQSAWRGTTKVNGPGQKAAANFQPYH